MAQKVAADLIHSDLRFSHCQKAAAYVGNRQHIRFCNKAILLCMCVSSDSMCVADGRFTLIPVSALTGATVWHGPGVLFMPAEHFLYFLNWVNRSCLGLIYSLSSPHSGMNSKEPHTPVNTAEQTLTVLGLVHIADIHIQTLSVRWRWRNVFLYVWIQSWMEALRRKAVAFDGLLKCFPCLLWETTLGRKLCRYLLCLSGPLRLAEE